MCFNPCFNGSMYKNIVAKEECEIHGEVSILVLMDLCIKTKVSIIALRNSGSGFNPCFNGSMYKNYMIFILFK